MREEDHPSEPEDREQTIEDLDVPDEQSDDVTGGYDTNKTIWEG